MGGVKTVLGATSIERLLGLGPDVNVLLDWVHYHDVLARFSLLHWKEGNKKRAKGLRLSREVMELTTPETTTLSQGVFGLLSLLGQVCETVATSGDVRSLVTGENLEDFKGYLEVLDWRVRSLPLGSGASAGGRKGASGYPSPPTSPSSSASSSRTTTRYSSPSTSSAYPASTGDVNGAGYGYSEYGYGNGYGGQGQDDELTTQLYQLATLIFLHRSFEGILDQPARTQAHLDKAFGLLPHIQACRQQFPILVIGCEARTDEQRAAVLDLIERTEYSSCYSSYSSSSSSSLSAAYSGYGSAYGEGGSSSEGGVGAGTVRSFNYTRRILQAMWAQDDLQMVNFGGGASSYSGGRGGDAVGYREKLGVVVGACTVLPCFV